MDSIQLLEKPQQEERLKDFLMTIDAHLHAANACRNNLQKEDLELEDLLDLLDECRGQLLELQSLVREGTEANSQWRSLDENWQLLSRDLSRFGVRSWISMGPTSSWRVNQLVHLCGQPHSDQISEAAEVVTRLVKQLRTRKIDSELREEYDDLLIKLKPLCSASVGNIHAERIASLCRGFERIAQFVDLSAFDENLQSSRDWIDEFQDLADRVAAGEVKAKYLCRERDVAVARLEELLPTTAASTLEVEHLPDVLLDILEHFSLMDEALRAVDDLDDWMTTLCELWAELESLRSEVEQSTVTRCTICSTAIPAGELACPSCDTPVTKIEDVPAEQSGESATGSSLLDALEADRIAFGNGQLNEETFKARLKKVERRLAVALRSFKGQEKDGTAGYHLESFALKLRDVIKLDKEKLYDEWDDLIRCGQALVQAVRNDDTDK